MELCIAITIVIPEHLSTMSVVTWQPGSFPRPVLEEKDMKSSQQCALAIQFKEMGLEWEPTVNYVYDATAAEAIFPFQEHVYFLLNYDCFMDRVGGVERLKTIMTCCHGAMREILRSLGVSNKEVQDEPVRSRATEDGSELLKLYELIAQHLSMPPRLLTILESRLDRRCVWRVVRLLCQLKLNSTQIRGR